MKKNFLKVTIVTGLLLTILCGCEVNGVDASEGVVDSSKNVSEEVEVNYSKPSYIAKVFMSNEVIELELINYIDYPSSEKVKLIGVDGKSYIASFSNVLIEEIE